MGMHAPLLKRSVGAVPSRTCRLGARRGFVSDTSEILTPSVSSKRGWHPHAHSKNTSEVTGHEFYQGIPPSIEHHHAAAASQPGGTFIGGWIFSMAVVGLTAIGGLCSAATCFILYIRPLLKSMEETCKAATEAAEQLEAASVELEKAALMVQEELPPATQAVDEASREFMELGETLNALSGGLSGFRSNVQRRKRQREKGEVDQGGKGIMVRDANSNGKTEPGDIMETDMRVLDTINATTEGIQRQTMDGISKVAADISSLAKALTPAMDMWQRRLAGIVNRVEDETHEIDDKNNNKKARLDEEEVDRLSASAWISNWRANLKEKSTTEETSSAGSKLETEKAVDLESENREVEEALDGVCVEIGGAPELDASGDEETSPRTLSEVSQDLDHIFQKIIVPQSKKSESAIAVIEALYKAEQAAEHAAQASGNLQAAVKRAQISGAFEGLQGVMDADGMASLLQSNVVGNSGERKPGRHEKQHCDSDDGQGRAQARKHNSEVPAPEPPASAT